MSFQKVVFLHHPFLFHPTLGTVVELHFNFSSILCKFLHAKVKIISYFIIDTQFDSLKKCFHCRCALYNNYAASYDYRLYEVNGIFCNLRNYLRINMI